MYVNPSNTVALRTAPLLLVSVINSIIPSAIRSGLYGNQNLAEARKLLY